MKLGGGVPTIAFRDIEIHRRDNDLVGATFGRGFYILDDYSPLRSLDAAVETAANSLFPVRDAWWYIPSTPMQAKGMPTLGSTSFVADNPPFGATFTYLLTDIPASAQMKRKESEKELRKDDKSIPFPGWDQLREEATEGSPQTSSWFATQRVIRCGGYRVLIPKAYIAYIGICVCRQKTQSIFQNRHLPHHGTQSHRDRLPLRVIIPLNYSSNTMVH